MKHDRQRVRIHQALISALKRAERRALKLEALEKQGGACLYCFLPIEPAETTAEHRKPKVRGGRDTPRNIAASCEPCNRTKGSRTERVFLRAVRRPDLERDGWDLYLRCMEIRLKRRTAQACQRLRSIVEARAA
jgi:5-methylcytosine-specific restriction endonuclease McrA